MGDCLCLESSLNVDIAWNDVTVVLEGNNSVDLLQLDFKQAFIGVSVVCKDSDLCCLIRIMIRSFICHGALP